MCFGLAGVTGGDTKDSVVTVVCTWNATLGRGIDVVVLPVRVSPVSLRFRFRELSMARKEPT